MQMQVLFTEQEFFSENKRYIDLISDSPHLLKTSCNCLNNSGCGKGTRFISYWKGYSPSRGMVVSF